MDTIKYLSSLIRTSNQWMNYMENVHEMGTISGRSDQFQVLVFHHQELLFRLCDMSVPQCNTGFVYMLVSTRVHTFSYIGDTTNIHTHLNQHNSGFGSHMTCPLSLWPYALFVYVCGFEGNKLLRRNVEE